MALRVFNTRSHAVEAFRTREPGVVRMYVCGPTVYERSHVGHARSYVVYDVMKRVFLARGWRVRHVQNFTDVEESVARRAREIGIAPLALADDLVLAFFEDMDALRVLRADEYPRVSEHVDDIQRAVESLVDREVAYPVDCHPGTMDGEKAVVCDVYFDVEKARDFGALVSSSLEDLSVDGMAEKGDRRHPLDFALWKSRDDWGVTWPSPWGDGRPGWHVECTVMSLKHLGGPFDLHGGGLDLVFPHHESERVIAEALTGGPYAEFFVHNGFVTVGNRKMSKSKGNFVTVRDLLRRQDAEALRVFLLSAHYRAPIDLDEAAIGRAGERLRRWQAAVATLQARGADSGAPAAGGPLDAERARFWDAIEDDFRFDRALDALDAAAARAHDVPGADAGGAIAFFREAADALGVLWEIESFSAVGRESAKK